MEEAQQAFNEIEGEEKEEREGALDGRERRR